MNHTKILLMAHKIDQTFSNLVKKKSIIYFQWFRTYRFFNEALQQRFFARKMRETKNHDR
jgi:hypothetical protein